MFLGMDMRKYLMQLCQKLDIFPVPGIGLSYIIVHVKIFHGIHTEDISYSRYVKLTLVKVA